MGSFMTPEESPGNKVLGLPELLRALGASPERLRRGIAAMKCGWDCLCKRFASFLALCSAARSADPKRLLSVAGAIFLLWGLGLSVWSFVDPFGLSSRTDAAVAGIAERAASPFYGSQAQDMITVVLVTDQTLKEAQMGWPPQYAYYAQLIRRIMDHDPKAVFLDVYLEDVREYDQTYAQARKELAEDLRDFGIPLLVAQSAPDAKSVFGDLAGTRPVKISWESGTDEYVLGEETARAVEGQAHVVGKWWDTAAFGLYREICSGNPQCASEAASMSRERLGAPMHVRWGRSVSRSMQELGSRGAHACVPSPDDFSGRALTAVRVLGEDLASGMMPGVRDASRVQCPYTDTIFAHELTGPSVDALLRDRAVLIGTSFAISNDLVLSPVHGKLPGVYFHAMALDNLITYGNRFYTHETPLWALIGAAILISLATSLIVVSQNPYPVMHFNLIMAAFLGVLIALFFLGHATSRSCVGVFSVFYAVYGTYRWLADKWGREP